MGASPSLLEDPHDLSGNQHKFQQDEVEEEGGVGEDEEDGGLGGGDEVGENYLEELPEELVKLIFSYPIDLISRAALALSSKKLMKMLEKFGHVGFKSNEHDAIAVRLFPENFLFSFQARHCAVNGSPKQLIWCFNYFSPGKPKFRRGHPSTRTLLSTYLEKTRFRHILFSNALEESNNFYPFILFLEKECLSRNLKLKWPLETLRFAAETGDLAFVEFARERYLSSIFEIQIQNAKFEKMQQDIEVLGEGYLKEVEENVPTRLVKIPTDEDVACTLILGAVRSGNVTLFDNLVKIEKKVYNPTNRNVAKVNLAEEALNGKGRRKESDPMLMVHRVVETFQIRPNSWKKFAQNAILKGSFSGVQYAVKEGFDFAAYDSRDLVLVAIRQPSLTIAKFLLDKYFEERDFEADSETVSGEGGGGGGGGKEKDRVAAAMFSTHSGPEFTKPIFYAAKYCNVERIKFVASYPFVFDRKELMEYAFQNPLMDPVWNYCTDVLKGELVPEHYKAAFESFPHEAQAARFLWKRFVPFKFSILISEYLSPDRNFFGKFLAFISKVKKEDFAYTKEEARRVLAFKDREKAELLFTSMTYIPNESSPDVTEYPFDAEDVRMVIEMGSLVLTTKLLEMKYPFKSSDVEVAFEMGQIALAQLISAKAGVGISGLNLRMRLTQMQNQ